MKRFLATLFALVMLLTAPAHSASAGLITLDLSTSAWQKFSAMGGSANWQSTADGLRIYGSGSRLMTEVRSNVSMDLRNATVYLKWLAHGPAGYYGAFGIGLAVDDPYNVAARALYFPTGAGWTWSRFGAGFTTHHSWESSRVIADDTWYYTRLLIDPDASVTAVTAINNYDTQGGTVFYSYDYQLQVDTWNMLSDVSVGAVFNDNYGSTNTWMMIGEAAYDAVPEPSAIVLFVTGCAAATVLWRRVRTRRRP